MNCRDKFYSKYVPTHIINLYTKGINVGVE